VNAGATGELLMCAISRFRGGGGGVKPGPNFKGDYSKMVRRSPYKYRTQIAVIFDEESNGTGFVALRGQIRKLAGQGIKDLDRRRRWN